MGSPLGNAVQFFKEFGLFDVILPFLLVFSVVFALLEKTKILGTEKISGTEYPRKNLNATVAFVVGMLVVATNKVVTAINIALPNIVLLIVAIVMFLMLVGTFYKTEELNFGEKHKTAMRGFVVLVFIAIILIFANSIMYDATRSWLEYILNYVVDNFSGTVVTSLIFLVVAVGAIYYIVSNPQGQKKGGE
ncbi:hypothetical protein HZB00_03570 [Candidatus Woesearchaeota archaeon]|nr:hypothetical protein [Candidatus Woesearchaeota archaeon]